MNAVMLQINNCIDCANHAVLADPDPDDWFCADDVKVICGLADKSKERTHKGGSCTGEPYITVACRPYNIRKECEIPDWCPLLRKEK